MYEQYLEDGMDYDKACQLLGCLDNRTVQRHRSSIEEIVEKANGKLSLILSNIPHLTNLPEIKPDMNKVKVLQANIEALNKASERQRGGAFTFIPLISPLHKTYYIERSRISIYAPDHVIFPFYFYDTS
jgi:hypothetical protein